MTISTIRDYAAGCFIGFLVMYLLFSYPLGISFIWSYVAFLGLVVSHALLELFQD